MSKQSARLKALSRIKKEATEVDDDEQNYEGNEDNAVDKNVAVNNWTDLETVKFLDQVNQQLDKDKNHITCCRRIAMFEWRTVKVGNKSPNEYVAYIKKMIANIPRHRTLGEVLEVYKNQRFDKGTLERLHLQAQETSETTDTSMVLNETSQPNSKKHKPYECANAQKKTNPAKLPSQISSGSNNDTVKKRKKGGAVKIQQEMDDMTSSDSDDSADTPIPIKRKQRPEEDEAIEPKKARPVQVPSQIRSGSNNDNVKQSKKYPAVKVKQELNEMTSSDSDDSVDAPIPINRKQRPNECEAIAPKKTRPAELPSRIGFGTINDNVKKQKKYAAVKVKQEMEEMTSSDSDDSVDTHIPIKRKQRPEEDEAIAPKKVRPVEMPSQISSEAKKLKKGGALPRVLQNTPETTNDSTNARVATHGPIKRKQKPEECVVTAPKKAKSGSNDAIVRKKRDRERIEPKQKPMEASNLIKSKHKNDAHKSFVKKKKKKNSTLEFDVIAETRYHRQDDDNDDDDYDESDGNDNDNDNGGNDDEEDNVDSDDECDDDTE